MRIIRDTREKNGWDFSIAGYETISQALSCGDYAIENCKNIIIERKASTGELYLNLGNKEHRQRFYREMVKLQDYKNAFIVCEFPQYHLYDFPKYSNIPEAKWPELKINAKFLRRLIYDIQDDYPPVQFIYCQDRQSAQNKVLDLLHIYGVDDGETC